MRALLLLNEKSRRGAESAAEVRERLTRCGFELLTDPNASVDTVIAAGGDGTIIRAVPVAMEKGVPLGLIPLGTFNDLARTLNVPAEIAGACEVISGGTTRAIDVGRVNGTYFVNESSIGLSTRIARRQTFRPIQLTVANSHHFGGFIEVDDAAIDDGRLDLYAIEVRNVLEAIPLSAEIAAHRLGDGPHVQRRTADRFTVATRRPHHVTADGEPAGFTPATFEVLPRAVRVFVPKE
jgi:diacylglycerol kinase family enzyme